VGKRCTRETHVAETTFSLVEKARYHGGRSEGSEREEKMIEIEILYGNGKTATLRYLPEVAEVMLRLFDRYGLVGGDNYDEYTISSIRFDIENQHFSVITNKVEAE
jgi:hypothetical protein